MKFIIVILSLLLLLNCYSACATAQAQHLTTLFWQQLKLINEHTFS